MKIQINNTSKYSILISINDEPECVIRSYNRYTKDIPYTESLNITISPYKKSKSKDGYINAVLKTAYYIIPHSELLCFDIKCEKNSVSYNTKYERLFLLSEDADCYINTVCINDEERLKRTFKRQHSIINSILHPFRDSLDWPAFVIIGIILAIIFGWKVTVIYSILAYIAFVIFDFTIGLLVKNVFKKITNLDDEKDFYTLTSPDFIKQYYISQGEKYI